MRKVTFDETLKGELYVNIVYTKHIDLLLGHSHQLRLTIKQKFDKEKFKI